MTLICITLILFALVLFWRGNTSDPFVAIIPLFFALLLSPLVFKPKGKFEWMNKSYSVYPFFKPLLKPLLLLIIGGAIAIYGRDVYMGLAAGVNRLQDKWNAAKAKPSEHTASPEVVGPKYESAIEHISVKPYLINPQEYVNANLLYSMSLERTDSRGFINVWQLRRELAVIEAMITTVDPDRCANEGEVYSDDPPSAKELKRREQKALKAMEKSRACLADMEGRYAEYMSASAEFNHDWLPLLIRAIQKGDPVAEVIMRQCQTTPILDRTQIESVCDPLQVRRDIAAKRLQEIGFSPAYEWGSKLAEKVRNVHTNGTGQHVDVEMLDLQEFALAELRQGVYGLPLDELTRFSNVARSQVQLETFHNAILIRLARKYVQRAFTLPEYSELRLNRSTLITKQLTWGAVFLEKAKHLRNSGDVYPYETHLSDSTEKRAVKIDPTRRVTENLVAGLDSKIFEKRLGEILAGTESTINRYLKQDPRWAVFLINRVGHHDYAPAGMTSSTHIVDQKLAGHWELEKTWVNWRLAPNKTRGSLEVKVDNEFMKATTITEGMPPPPLQNVQDCLLRKSGGVTYLWSREGVTHVGFEGHPSYESSTPFGDISGYGVLRAVIEGMDENHPDIDIDMNVFARFDPVKRYEQVLMQCQGGEAADTDRVRFLLLVEDALIEVATEASARLPIFIRQYQRVAAVK